MSGLPATTSCLRGDHVECSGTCIGPERRRIAGDPPDAYIKRPCGCPCHRDDLAPVELLRQLAAQADVAAQSELDLYHGRRALIRGEAFREVETLLGRPRAGG